MQATNGMETARIASQIDLMVEAYESARASGDDRCITAFLPALGDRAYEPVAAELIRVDMEWSWERGTPRGLSDYDKLLPAPLSEPSLRRMAAYEEYRLRAQDGQPVAPDEFGRRYGIDSRDWPSKEVLRDAAAARESDPWRPASSEANFPELGSRFEGFELVDELGRGAFARVYLARQADLSDRPVALKIVGGSSLEPQHLARLQHANIVPIYSVHRNANNTAVCMPFLGRRTLEDLLAALRRQYAPGTSSSHRLGDGQKQNRISTFICRRDETITDRPRGDANGPNSDDVGDVTPLVPDLVATLSRVSEIDAAVWLAAQIAQGLAHAHARGIVHRDVKPANVLLGDDGTPMLLDFNLSDGAPFGGPSRLAGGTLPYMSPEQLASVAGGVDRVGPQTDLYALGIILYELLTGRRPFPEHRGALSQIVPQMIADRATIPSVRALNRMAPRSIDSLVQRCLAADPAQRYATADSLRDDLERHLHHLPLRYASDRAPIERMQKWARRHPRLVSTSGVALAAAGCLAIVAALWWGRGLRLARIEAEQAFNGFCQETRESQMALGMRRLAAEAPHLMESETARARKQIDAYGVLDDPAWQLRDAYRYLPTVRQDELRMRLGETLYLMGRAAMATAQPNGDDRQDNSQNLAEPLLWNERALALYEPEKVPAALAAQRAEMLERTGEDAQAAEWRKTAESRLATSQHDASVDVYGRVDALLDDAKYADAVPLLAELRDRHPTDPVIWARLGEALSAQGAKQRGESHFEIAAALAPDSYMAHFELGLNHLDLKLYERAVHDFDEAIRLRPELAEGYLNRAIALQGVGRLTDAEADATRAIKLGTSQSRAFFLRAPMRRNLGDAQGAQDDVAQGMRRVPTDELSWIARGFAQLDADPAAALADFQQALRVNPFSVPALRNVVHVCGDRLDMPDAAREATERLLTIDPNDVAARAGRAVLYAKTGERDAALSDVKEILKLSTSPQTLFQAACVLALVSQDDQDQLPHAATLLARAALADVRWLERSKTDPDLANLRRSPFYENLVSNWATSR